jgi:hypothetical protein
MSGHPFHPIPNNPLGSTVGLPREIPGYTNINHIRDLIHLPGLHPEANITSIHFSRRKPKGFSNGHYLQFNPQAFKYNPTFKRRYFTLYVGGFFFFNGIFAMQQYRRGKWFFGERYTPPLFNDEYLARINRVKK